MSRSLGMISLAAAVLLAYFLCTSAEGLNDLMARLSNSDTSTRKPSGLDTLLDSHEQNQESRHHKSWKKLGGHHHKTLSSFLDEYYPETTTPGHKSDTAGDPHPLSPFLGEYRPETTPPEPHGRQTHEAETKERHSLSSLLEEHYPDSLLTTQGPLTDTETSGSWEERKPSLHEHVGPTRHHHRYHRADNQSPHQPQADSTFSQPSVSGYYDYSGGNPTVKNTRLSSTDWRKNARKPHDRSRWSPNNRNNGVVISSLPRGENDAYAQRQVSLHVKAAREMTCKVPQPKVIRIADHYPSADKVYIPSCTKLHQCAQDTGCCPSSQRCGPKSTERVELYFYTSSMFPNRASGTPSVQIEKLPFYNHTECECQGRNDEMPRDKEQLSSNSIDSLYTLDISSKNVCLCPAEFTLKFLPDGSCACDCFDKQKECTKYKRGKDFFNHKDKLCIALGKCVVPMCDYGSYSRRYGRCPRKHERHKGSWSSKYN